jgi:hypothetical protein
MNINSIDNVLDDDTLIFHWTKYEYIESILKKGIMSIDLMKKRGIQYDYAPDIAQQLYGTNMISVITFIGKKTPHEIFLERKNQCIYERPPKSHTHKCWHIFRNDVTFVINPKIKTMPLGWYPYEHLVKDIVNREDILVVCCNKKMINQTHEKNFNDIEQNIKRICEKYKKKCLINDR